MPFTEQQLQQGLLAGEFIPFFQPLVDIRAGHIRGFEILARWEHPTQGLVPPSVFVPLLERSSLVNNLSATLLSQAFAAVRDLPTDFGLSVNLSPGQLHDRTLPTLIQIMAEEAEFDLRRLTVELTETALVDDLDLAGAVAADLKGLGIRLALDDFGTGYSSLLHLQSLPFDQLKVDAGFVQSMVHSRQSRKITAAVISLGLSLGLQTVAEGIEEQSQANLLGWQGCHLGQGYLYGRPIAAEDLPGKLAQRQLSSGFCTEVPASIADPCLALDTHPTERLSQLRAIYDGSPVGLAFLNPELRYVNLNQQLAQMNGRSLQAHLGRTVREIVSAEVYAQFEPYLHRALKGESFPGVEVERSPRVPGEPATFVLITYQPVRDEAGEILGVCVSIADISALKQQAEALRESEDHYRHTVELNPQIPWVTDAEGNNVSVSSRWETVTGLSDASTKNHGWMDAVHPDDLHSVRSTLQKHLRTGEPIDLQYRVLSQDREWIWMRSRGAPRRDCTGKIVRWYGSVESIDEHKRAVDQLRVSEARLRAIFDAAPVGIVLAESATGIVLDANPRAEQLIGFRFQPNMVWCPEGWRAYDCHGLPIPASQLPLMRAIRSGETTKAEEMFLCRPDGSTIWLSITALPVCLDDGAQTGALLLIQDIDAGKRERQRLLELEHELTLVGCSALYRPAKPPSRASRPD